MDIPLPILGHTQANIYYINIQYVDYMIMVLLMHAFSKIEVLNSQDTIFFFTYVGVIVLE